MKSCNYYTQENLQGTFYLIYFHGSFLYDIQFWVRILSFKNFKTYEEVIKLIQVGITCNWANQSY